MYNRASLPLVTSAAAAQPSCKGAAPSPPQRPQRPASLAFRRTALAAAACHSAAPSFRTQPALVCMSAGRHFPATTTLASALTALPPHRRRRAAVVPAAQKQQYSTFEELLGSSELPLLVDFYATWCGPCQVMSPVLSAVATRLKGRLQVVKIDTDRYPGIASQYKVQALPTLALFVGGKVVFRFEGLLPEGQLLERLNYYLAGSGQGREPTRRAE